MSKTTKDEEDSKFGLSSCLTIIVFVLLFIALVVAALIYSFSVTGNMHYYG